MKIYRYIAKSFTATFDNHELLDRINNDFPELKADIFEINSKSIGIHLENFIQGKIVFKQPQHQCEFKIDSYIYNFGVMISEICFDSNSLVPQLKTLNLLEDRQEIYIDEKLVEDPLTIYLHKFFLKIFQLPSIIPKLNDFSILDKKNSEKLNQIFQQLSSLDPFYLRDEIIFDVVNEAKKHIIVIYDDTKQLTEMNEKTIHSDKIIEQDNIFYCSEPLPQLNQELKLLISSDQILRCYRLHLMNWIKAIRAQAKLVKINLDQTNKVYWDKLKNTFEIWDLNYLESYSAIVITLDFIQHQQYLSFNSNYINNIKKDFNRSINTVLRNLDDVKYGLSNLITPCHTHDEQILQKETEKGNERIMLLSFLAMAIPLLGAILAPGISILTKIIAALILFSFPLVYLFFRKFQIKKSHKKATFNYLNNLKQNYLEQDKYLENLKNKIYANNKVSEKTKQESLYYLNLNRDTIRKDIAEIDQEIRKL